MFQLRLISVRNCSKPGNRRLKRNGSGSEESENTRISVIKMSLVKGMEHINAQVAIEYTFWNTVYPIPL